jgi:hypothetical protein
MYVDPTDLEYVGSSAPVASVVKWIDKAEVRLGAMAAARGYTLAAIAQDPARLALMKDVIENAVVRVLRNPDGFKSETEDGYSYTFGSEASGSVWFPAADLDALFPTGGAYGSISLALPAFRQGSW